MSNDNETSSRPNLSGRCVVALPCYNEAPALPAVVASWRATLPDVEIVVFDNNSTDGTADVARRLGARVVPVPLQGKGHAVQAIFREFPAVDAVIMTDGDGTYPPEAAPKLIELVLSGKADMAVGARRPVAAAGAMTPLRSLGNMIIPAAFYLLIGPGNSDLLSGYRVFSRSFRERVRLRSSGFEIETELASEAVARGLSVVEIPVPYLKRAEGTTSKLKVFRDGRRILVTIFRQSARLRPWRLLTAFAIPLFLLGLAVRSNVLMLCGGTLAVVATALVAMSRTWDREL